MNWMIWMSEEPPGHCTLDPVYIPTTRKLNAGEPVAGEFPTDIQYSMSDRFPDDLLLSDNFKVAGQVVVSGTLKSHLTSILPDHRIEYLPVEILNHKQRVASADYFIVHSLDVVDCIDIDKSKVEWNPLNTTKILSAEGLVIDTVAISSHLRLFRPKHWGENIIVDSELVEELQRARFTGLRFIPVDGFTGIG
jgi:hypothetical protein